MWAFIRFSLVLFILIIFGSCAMFLSNHNELWVRNVIGQNHLQRLGWVVGLLEALPGINRQNGANSYLETADVVRAVVEEVGSNNNVPFHLTALGAARPDQVMGCPDLAKCPTDSLTLSLAQGMDEVSNNKGQTVGNLLQRGDSLELVATSYSPSLQVAFDLTLDPDRSYAIEVASWGCAVTACGFMCITLVLWQIVLSTIGALKEVGEGGAKMGRNIGLLAFASVGTVLLFFFMFFTIRSVNDELLRSAMAADNEATCLLLDGLLSSVPLHVEEDAFLAQMSATLETLNKDTEQHFDQIDLHRSVQKLFLRSLNGQVTQIVPPNLVADLDQATPVASTFSHAASGQVELNTVMVSSQMGDGTSMMIHTVTRDMPLFGSSAVEGIFILGIVLLIIGSLLYTAACMMATTKQERSDDDDSSDPTPDTRPNSGPSNQVVVTVTVACMLMVLGCTGIPLLAVSQHGASFTKAHKVGFDGATNTLRKQLSVSTALLDISSSLLQRSEMSEAETAALMNEGQDPLTAEGLAEISAFYASVQNARGANQGTKHDMINLFASQQDDGSVPGLATNEVDALLDEMRNSGNTSRTSVEQLATAIHELELEFILLITRTNATLFEERDVKLRAYITGNLTDLSSTVPVATTAILTQLTAFIVPSYTSLASVIAATDSSHTAVEALYQSATGDLVVQRDAESQGNFSDALASSLAVTSTTLTQSYVELLFLVVHKTSTWAYVSLCVMMLLVVVWVVTQGLGSVTRNASQEVSYLSKNLLSLAGLVFLVVVCCLVGLQYSASGSVETFEQVAQDELSNRRLLLINRVHVRTTEALRLLAMGLISSDSALASHSLQGAANLTSELVSLRSFINTAQLWNLTMLNYEMSNFLDQFDLVAKNWTFGVTAPYYPPSQLAGLLEKDLVAMKNEILNCTDSQHGGVVAVGNFSKYWASALREVLSNTALSETTKENLEKHLELIVSKCNSSINGTDNLKAGMDSLEQVVALRAEVNHYSQLSATSVQSLIAHFKTSIEPMISRALEEASDALENEVRVDNREVKSVFWVPVVCVWILGLLLGGFWISSARDLVELGTLREGRRY